MKIYIQSRENGVPRNYNFMNAYQGFEGMGFEIVPFRNNTILKKVILKMLLSDMLEQFVQDSEILVLLLLKWITQKN